MRLKYFNVYFLKEWLVLNVNVFKHTFFCPDLICLNMFCQEDISQKKYTEISKISKRPITVYEKGLP